MLTLVDYEKDFNESLTQATRKIFSSSPKGSLRKHPFISALVSPADERKFRKLLVSSVLHMLLSR